LQSAQAIHNLVRAVAPPYPGAYTLLAGKPVRVLKTLLESQRQRRAAVPVFYCENGRCYAECGDGKVLRILAFEFDGRMMTADEWIIVCGGEALPLGR
jgi:methionyl-tRNA formyltransferase